ncbi:hypothetical protein [Streptomyces sp. A 4/2]|nr:hypothetical protein [Streptomyces sp. A 4/2]
MAWVPPVAQAWGAWWTALSMVQLPYPSTYTRAGSSWSSIV